MLILNVLMLIAVSFALGYYLGKGRIEIRRVMNKEDSARVAKETLELLQDETIYGGEY